MSKSKAWRGCYYGIDHPMSNAQFRRLVKSRWPVKLDMEIACREFDSRHFRRIAPPRMGFSRRTGWLDRVQGRRRTSRLGFEDQPGATDDR